MSTPLAGKTVKARAHAGATSLDLTIPSAVCKQYGLAVGDVWTIEAGRADGGDVVLRYRRVGSGDSD